MRVFLLFFLAAPFVPRILAQSNFPQLLAKGPEAKYQEKLQLFGQFVGSWTFDGKQYGDDGSQTTDKGEIHFHWVLQGRAVQDVWLETENSQKSALLYGTTIRFYDPKTETWSSTWIEPRAGVVRVFVGRKVGSEIVLEGNKEDGTPIRWIFSEIGATSFHWRGEKKTGSGWHVYEELDARKTRSDGQ
jgi:hypothetical protein